MSCGWLLNPEGPWASGGSWAELGLAGVVAESVFLNIMLAGWWVGPVPEMACFGFWGVSGLVLTHWGAGLDPRVAG